MSTVSTTVLGKRRKTRLLLRLSSSPAPSEDPIQTRATASRYPCSYPECTKSYSKPSKLAQHQRSHTGERPFVCNSCGKSYLRETHLQAHQRSHLPQSERPYVCTESAGCTKRFWTFQHLVVHENSHRGNKSCICPEAGCDQAFSKHHQLRAHVCEAHAPAGTKPYICSHPGCTKSFPTNHKLRGHSKTHDDKRYTCSHRSCLPGPNDEPVYFGTWTALQAHVRKEHPPTCMHTECDGRTFASQHSLRSHQKLHEQREAEASLYNSERNDAPEGMSDAEGSQPRKRRRGGELGRDWSCDIQGCGKEFKSKRALATHHNVIHLGQRNHVCLHVHCKSAFGYKHLLERHLAKLHSSKSDHAETASEGESSVSEVLGIEAITGKAYATRLQSAKSIRCPYPHVGALATSSAAAGGFAESSSKLCEHVLTRAYDLRRHLKSEHGVDTEKATVDAWVNVQRRSAR